VVLIILTAASMPERTAKGLILTMLRPSTNQLRKHSDHSSNQAQRHQQSAGINLLGSFIPFSNVSFNFLDYDTSMKH
jgi:hypothetical protein